VAEYLEMCRVQKKGYLHIGVRQFGKSEIMASYMGYHAVLFEHTQNVIVGGNDDDLQLLRDKIDFGIKNLWEGIRIPKLDKDTRKNMTRLGYKAKGGEDNVWSYLIVRNVAEGNKTEGPAGVTAKAYATDEIGKFAFAQSFEAAKPAFRSKFGWRCVPILFGTGGSFEKGADAERYFNHPDANNFLAVTDPITGKRTAIFMSGIYRIDCKYKTTLREYLIKEGKLDINSVTPSLAKYEIQVSDKEKAKELILKERAEKAKDPDKVEYLKQVMYYPLTPEECFISSADNIFNRQLCESQIGRIDLLERTGTPVDMFHDGERITYLPSSKLPIAGYPLKPQEPKDAPVVIYEHPVENPPYGLYVAGVDPYRQGKAEHSKSLGAVYIYKRMNKITGEGFQDMFVASYVARPERKEDWEEQARLLIKYYNARTLCENDEMSFIDYMIAKGDAHYLEAQPEWLKELVPNTTQKRDYGISRSAEKVRNFLNGCLKTYTEEVLKTERDKEGSIIREILGVIRILDRGLLQEMAKYNEDDNFDRIIAASLAIALANKMDQTLGAANTDDEMIKALMGKRPITGNVQKSMFNNNPSSKKGFKFNTGKRLF